MSSSMGQQPGYGDWTTRELMRELVQRLYPKPRSGSQVVESGYHTSIQLGDQHFVALGVYVGTVQDRQESVASDRSDPRRSGQVRLTRTQLEVLSMYARGRRVSEIAEERFSSENTIRNHLKECRRKFDVSRSDEAAATARQLGMI